MILLTEIQCPPEELDRLLRKHHLLSVALRLHPQLVAAMAAGSRVNVMHEDSEILGVMVETPLPDPTLLEVLIVPEVRRLHQAKDELAELSTRLRQSWFGNSGFRRIQAAIPSSRIHTKKIFKAMGFVEETRDCGLRNSVNLGKEYEAMTVLGLLPSDPEKKPFAARAEVSHGVE